MTKVVKTKYHIHNWAEYNRALINRGSLTIWFEDSPEKWLAIKQPDKMGRPRTYSDSYFVFARDSSRIPHAPESSERFFTMGIFHDAIRIACALLYTHLPKSGQRRSGI